MTAAPLAAGNNVWTSGTPAWGPENVFSLAMSHQDGMVYARSPLGMFVSRDFGRSWSYTDLGLGDSCCEQGLVTVDPRNPGTAYADTYARGLLKTRDGGATWQTVGSGLPSLTVASPLIIDPSDSSTLYLGFDGVYKSQDGGTTWTLILPGSGISALAIDPSDSGVVYAASSAGVMKSIDGGHGWSPSSQGLPAQTYFSSLLVDPLQPSTLYASTTDGVFKSTDGAARWSKLETAPDLAFTSLAASAADSGAVLGVGFDTLGHASVFRSVDRGASWTLAYSAAAGEYLRVVAASPVISGLFLAAGTDLQKSTDSGVTWAQSGSPATVGGVSLLASTARPGTLFAAGGTNVVSRSDDGGLSWQSASTGLPGQPILSLQFDSTGTAVFAATSVDLHGTENAGIGWDLRAQFDQVVNGAVVDPFDAKTIYIWEFAYCGPYCGRNTVRATRDAGQTWTALIDLYGAVPLKVFPPIGNGSGVYALVSGQVFAGNASALEPKGSLPDYASAADLAIDPTNPSRIWAISYLPEPGRLPIYRSENGGATWTPLSELHEILESAVLVDPASPATIYLSTYGDGVFRSVDGGVTWSRVGQGLADPHIRSLALSPDGKTLYAGTDHAVYQYTFCDSCQRPAPRLVPEPPRAPAVVERQM